MTKKEYLHEIEIAKNREALACIHETLINDIFMLRDKTTFNAVYIALRERFISIARFEKLIVSEV